MLRHLLKLVWKRKGRNMMLSLEIMIAFAIVFAVAAMALRYLQIYHEPVGYQYQDVWSVRMQAPGTGGAGYTVQTYQQFAQGVRELPEVRQLSFASTGPYSGGEMQTFFRQPQSGRRVLSQFITVDDQFFDVLSVPLAAGRTFDQRDNGMPGRVIINRQMARDLFGDADPIGQTFDSNSGPGPATNFHVIGVVEHFRRAGELATPMNVVLGRDDLEKPDGSLEMMVIKLAPGTTRQFEQTLLARLRQVRADWEYTITPLTAARELAMNDKLVPLLIFSIIAVFMLAMVAVGLFGVLWQNISQRVPEIGLRRAVGASARDIYRQIVGEQLLQSSAAMVAGLFLLVQLPLTGVLGEALNWSVFGAAAVLSIGVIYLLSLLCALYPGWRASRLTPTEALHYE